MNYRAPTHILEVLQKIEYEEALPAGDPRYVDTGKREDVYSLGTQIWLGSSQPSLFCAC